uniref:Copia protein n=1 Tax=Tanacetum cinerariifolium TaxID=118510 RepID=A0A6L2NS00_TANCI|nr:copia protein [Tanacetum cinerariifolium]
MCARYQAKPIKKHLEAIKRVFCYLRGTINWGLYYPKDTTMALTAYADADHAGCQDTRRNKMAEENLPDPTRSDEQLVPAKARLPYGKSNLLLDLQKLQKNPIFRISVDILQNTNFFRAFSVSANVPSIYLQQLWNTLTHEAKTGVFRTNVDYAKLLWEEFVQGIQTFFTHWESNKISSKKPTPHAILYCCFKKLIIYYLGSKYNIHKRPESPRHVTGNDFLFGNLKFVPKASNADKSKKPASSKQSKPAPTHKPKVSQEKPLKPSLEKKVSKGKVAKVRKGKSGFQLVDEEEQTKREPEPQGEEYYIEQAIQMSLESFQAPGQAPVGGVAICEPVAKAT